MGHIPKFMFNGWDWNPPKRFTPIQFSSENYIAATWAHYSMQIPQKTWRIQQEFDDFPWFAHEKHEKPAINPWLITGLFARYDCWALAFFSPGWANRWELQSLSRCLNRPSHGAVLQLVDVRDFMESTLWHEKTSHANIARWLYICKRSVVILHQGFWRMIYPLVSWWSHCPSIKA